MTLMLKIEVDSSVEKGEENNKFNYKLKPRIKNSVGFFILLSIYNNMGKIIRLSESELVNLIQKIVLNYSIISEVKIGQDFTDETPKYEYKKIGIIPNYKNEIGYVFFNGPYFQKSDYQQPETPKLIHFSGPHGDFEFDSSIIRISKDGIPYISGKDLDKQDYNRLIPLMKIKSSKDFTSGEIRKSLKIAFPEYWHNEDDEYSAGIRGIHTIGEKTDINTDWSIMNYFDTKKEIKDLINKKWEKEGSGNKIEWLSSVFKNDRKFLDNLLERQLQSIKKGIENQKQALKNITDLLKVSNINFKFEVYPDGHVKDRHDSIDLTLEIENKGPMTIQIKPLTRIEELPNGDIKVYTYGMSNEYKKKTKLGYIMYSNKSGFIIFKNENYDAIDKYYYGNKVTEVIHKDRPIEL